MNSNWQRWIYASCAKHFSDLAYTNNLVFRTEDEEVPVGVDKVRLDFYFDGPVMTILQGGIHRLVFELNIAILYVPAETDLYKIQTLEGLVTSFFTTIQTCRFGTSADSNNDASLLGCLDLDGMVTVRRLGRPAPNTMIVQSMVEGRYIIELED